MARSVASGRIAAPPGISSLACLVLATLLLAACSTTSEHRVPTAPAPEIPGSDYFTLADQAVSREIVMFAFGLLDTGYRFGGSNPDAGLDCSGMVSYIVEQVSGRRLPHNAAQIATMTRPVAHSALRPGDLVFFNTGRRAYSHMGIFLGDGKFIHAPSRGGKVRIERMDNPYFRERFEAARSLFAQG
jgi:cell wall-associated NlpC family hydrolase